MSRIIIRGAFIVILGLVSVGFFSCQKTSKPTSESARKEAVKEEKPVRQVQESRQVEQVKQKPSGEKIGEKIGEKTQKEVTRPKRKTVTKAPSKIVRVPEQFHALITFLSGNVYVSKVKGAWKEAEIGESLDEGDFLRVDEDSYCEVQFGNTATIRIQQNTEVSLKKVLLQMEVTRVKVGLVAGSLLCKVRKLSKNDRFKVQTPSVVCGVRGTQFGVKYDKDKGTVVAVKKGKVAVLPSVLDVDVIKERLKNKSKELLAVLEKVEEVAPVVTANRELKVNTAAVNQAEKEFKSVVTKIVQVATTQKVIAPEKIKEVTKLVDQAVTRVKKEISHPVVMSKRTLEELKPIDAIKIIEIPLSKKVGMPSTVPEETSGVGHEEIAKEVSKGGVSKRKGAPISLERIGIEVEPTDAAIFLNGNPVGKGTFFGLFKPGEKLIFIVEKEGFVSKKIEIDVTKGSGRIYQVRLEEKKEKIEINVIPRDAEIVIDGNVVGRGSYSSSFVVGKVLNVECRREGYIARSLRIEVEKGGKNRYSVVIKPKRIPFKYSVAKKSIVGKVAVFGNLIVVADTDGSLYGVDGRGSIIWRVRTKNSPNVNSFPVRVGNKIFFSGSSEFVVLNALTGSVDYREELTGNSSHVFGRHVVKYRDKVLFPTDDVILVREVNGRIIRKVKVPGGSKMTPVVYKNSILIVNQKGVFYRIDFSSGKVIAKLETRAIQPVAVTVTVHGNRAFFSGRRGTVVCIDLAKSSIVWQRKVGGTKSVGVFHDLVYGSGGIFMFAKNSLYAFRASDGRTLFPPVRGISAPPLYYRGRLYVGKTDGSFVVINVTNGRIIKTLKMNDVLTTQPRIMKDMGMGNIIVVGTKRGKLIAINPQGIE